MRKIVQSKVGSREINGNGSKRDNKTVCAHAAIFSREIELSQVDADFANISNSQKTPEYSTF